MFQEAAVSSVSKLFDGYLVELTDLNVILEDMVYEAFSFPKNFSNIPFFQVSLTSTCLTLPDMPFTPFG